MRKLDDWITGWLEFVDNTEPPICYKEWVAISTIASALQRKCCINLGHLVLYPNMYIVLIGPPGARKSTAMEPARGILSQKGIKLSADATTKEALVRSLKLSSTSVSSLATGETVGHASLTIFSPELTVFIGYDNLQLMTYLNNWWDCQDPWEYDTKDAELRDYIPAVWVNMIGATTPEILQTALPSESIGLGFTSRVVFVHAYKKGKVVPVPFISKEAQRTREDLFADYERIYLLSGEFKYTKGFIDSWVDWRFDQEKNPPFQDPKLSGYVEKRPAHILKLCMVVSASESDSMEINERTLGRATKILSRVERNMLNVFSGYGENRDAKVMTEVMRIVGLAGEKGIPFSILMDKFKRDANKDTMLGIISTLESIKYCRRDRTDASDPRIVYTPKKEETNGESTKENSISKA